MEAFPEYWGDARQGAEPDHPVGHRGQSARHGAPGRDRGRDRQCSARVASRPFRATRQFQLMPREGLNTLLSRLQQQPQERGFDNSQNPLANEKVRQAIAMGINRDQIAQRVLPARLGGRDPLHAVRHPERLRRRSVVRVRRRRGEGAPYRGRLPGWLRNQAELSAGGPRLPARSARRCAGDPGAAPGEPEHQRDPRSAGRHDLSRQRGRWHCSTGCICSAGAPTIRT